MVDAGSIWIKLGLNTDELKFGLDKAKYSMLEWRGEMNKSASDLTKWGAAFAVPIAAATTMIMVTNDLIQSAERYQDEIEQFSLVTGMSTDATQKWRAAAIATDTDFSSLTASLQYMNARIVDNSTAGDELRSTLDSLGVQYKDNNGEYLDSDTLLQNIMASMSRLSTAQERDAVANAIFGRSWYNLAEMINNADKALAAYKAASPAISEEDLKKVDEFKTKWAELADQIDITKAKIGIGVIDALDAISHAGAITAVKASSAGMAVTGVSDYLTTGNAAILDEAIKRMANPEAYTKEALAKQEADYKALQAQQGTKGAATEFTDKYAGLTDKEIELKKVTDDLTEAEKNRAAAVTQADYDKYSLQIATLTNKQKDLTAAIKEGTDAEKERVSALVSTWEEYENKLKTVIDQKTKLNDLDLNYIEDMQATGRDVSAARSLTMSYNKAKRTTVSDLETDVTDLAGTATRFNLIKSSVPLEQIQGTSQYTEAQAKASGDLIINLDGKELARISGVIGSTSNGKLNLMQRGIS